MCINCFIAQMEELDGHPMGAYHVMTQALLLDGVPAELVQKVITAGDAITEWYRDRPTEEKS